MQEFKKLTFFRCKQCFLASFKKENLYKNVLVD